MLVRRLLMTALVCVLVALSWHPSVNQTAEAQVDAGLKRALVTFASARVLNGVISVVQGTEVVAQPLGFGVTLSVGEILDPVNDLVEQFSNLMLAASVAFGVEKFLLSFFGSDYASAVTTVILLGWLAFYWRGWRFPWLDKVLAVMVFVRFAMPLMTIGSGMIYEHYSAATYSVNQAALVGASSDPVLDVKTSEPRTECKSVKCKIEDWWSGDKDKAESSVGDLRKKINNLKAIADQTVDSVVNLIVVFLLQTLIFPLLFLWMAYKLAFSTMRWIGPSVGGKFESGT